MPGDLAVQTHVQHGPQRRPDIPPPGPDFLVSCGCGLRRRADLCGEAMGHRSDSADRGRPGPQAAAWARPERPLYRRAADTPAARPDWRTADTAAARPG